MHKNIAFTSHSIKCNYYTTNINQPEKLKTKLTTVIKHKLTKKQLKLKCIHYDDTRQKSYVMRHQHVETVSP